MSGRLAGRTALVTGGAGGIGFAIARALAREGAHVVLGDRDEPRVAAAAGALRDEGCAAHAVVLDVASEAAWDALASATDGALARLHVLVNAAGIFARVRQPLDAVPFSEWRDIMAVNLDSVFLGTRFAVRRMKERGGAIVNIGSMAGERASRGGVAYGASKGGVGAFTRQAAWSCAQAGYAIRVNCILPGYVWTPGVSALAEREYGGTEAAREGYARRHPLPRLIEPEDVAHAAVYLASDEARAVTGVQLPVDGGLLAALWGVQ